MGRPAHIRPQPETAFVIALRAIVVAAECAAGFFLADFDAGAAADAALRIKLWFGHADDAKIVHAYLGAVVWAAGEGDLKMQVVGKNRLFNTAREGGGVIASKRTDLIADAGGDVACAAGGIAAIRVV